MPHPVFAFCRSTVVFISLSLSLSSQNDGCCNDAHAHAHAHAHTTTPEDHDHQHEYADKSTHGHSHEHMDHPGSFESRGPAKKRKYGTRAFVVGIGKEFILLRFLKQLLFLFITSFDISIQVNLI